MNGIIAMESRMQRKLHVRFGGGNRADSRSSTTPTQLDEGMGPCEAKCPTSILDLLGPARNEYAAEWRKRCRAWNALARRPRPKPGDTIILAEPITFTDGYEGSHFEVFAYRKGIALRSPAGGNYRISRLMERNWTRIPASPVLAKGKSPAHSEAQRGMS